MPALALGIGRRVRASPWPARSAEPYLVLSAVLASGLYGIVKGNLTGRNIDDGVARYREGRHDGGFALDLRQTVGIPHTLADIGIDEAQAERVGRMASEDSSGGTNLVAYTPGQYAELFCAAVRGIL